MNELPSTGRRELLSKSVATAATTVAGCLGSPPAPENDDSHSDDVLATAAVDDVDHDDLLSLGLAVEVLEAEITAETPATLRVEVRNESDESVTVGEARTIRFDLARSEGGDPQLVLLPSAPNLDRDASDCWKLYEGAPLERLAVSRTETLAPGESYGLVLEVWWDGQGACFPTGTFAFETVVSSSRSNQPSEGGERSWGFDLSIQR